jgi:hypothetical protein
LLTTSAPGRSLARQLVVLVVRLATHRRSQCLQLVRRAMAMGSVRGVVELGPNPVSLPATTAPAQETVPGAMGLVRSVRNSRFLFYIAVAYVDTH